jgi:FKBP-type peptidyl-prolyl cis-trans isomerase (trigger factor)
VLDESWTNVIAGSTKLKGQRFTVIVHSIKTNRVETINQEQAIAYSQAHDPQLKKLVR